jgi:hypothetical protein
MGSGKPISALSLQSTTGDGFRAQCKNGNGNDLPEAVSHIVVNYLEKYLPCTIRITGVTLLNVYPDL